MKISDITQRSQAQHLAEGRKQLDEIAPAVWGALGITGAGMTAYETWQNYKAYERGEIDKKELAARVGGDVALGLIGGGGLSVAKALSKGAWRGAKKLMGFGDDSAKLAVDKADAIKNIKKAEDEVDAAKQLNKQTPRGGITKSADKKAAQELEKEAKADLRHAQITKKELNKRMKDARILPTKGELVKNAVKGAVLGLAVPDSLDPLRDPAYKALGGADPHGQPKAGESLADAEARRKAEAAARKARYKSDYITKGITTIDPQ